MPGSAAGPAQPRAPCGRAPRGRCSPSRPGDPRAAQRLCPQPRAALPHRRPSSLPPPPPSQAAVLNHGRQPLRCLSPGTAARTARSGGKDRLRAGSGGSTAAAAGRRRGRPPRAAPPLPARRGHGARRSSQRAPRAVRSERRLTGGAAEPSRDAASTPTPGELGTSGRRSGRVRLGGREKPFPARGQRLERPGGARSSGPPHAGTCGADGEARRGARSGAGGAGPGRSPQSAAPLPRGSQWSGPRSGRGREQNGATATAFQKAERSALCTAAIRAAALISSSCQTSIFFPYPLGLITRACGAAVGRSERVSHFLKRAS